MNDSQQVQAIDITIDDAKKKIEMANDVIALRKNKHFKRLIEDGYFKDEAQRVVYARANIENLDELNQAYLLKSTDSIAFFRAYLAAIQIEGRSARNALTQHELTREEILAEELLDANE